MKKTIILRHKKENLKKCSLRGLETRDDILFFTYPKDTLPSLHGYVLLTPDAPLLTRKDQDQGLFLLDGTWRYAEKMYRNLPKPHEFALRSLPPLKTAYPRRQEIEVGLASIEALYAAYCILGKDPEGLLNHYHWKNEFIEINRSFW